MGKDLYELGEVAPIGDLPPKMYANAVRPENYGEPEQAFRIEVLDTPKPARNQVVVQVMAAGVNYNNVWAAKGIPLDVTKVHEKLGQPAEFHIGGSDASGIVAAIGEGVSNVKVGDRVVVHCGWFDPEDAEIVAGRDPGFTSTYKIWGYETNYGSFAQFCLAYAHQCMPKAEQLTWEEAAAPTLVGATAYRMLRGWPPNVVNEGDPILIWGGSGGLGSMAIQIVKEFGGLPVAVVSSDEKGEYTKKLGAVGYINRKDFSHWGVPPHWKDPEWKNWFSGAKDFGKKFWEVLGERRNPAIVFEHPGEDTVPTSIFVADPGGMVVICAGTTGYSAVADLRYLWMFQKRFQGSHFANDEQANAFNKLVIDGKIDPCMGRVFTFDEIGLSHQLMSENKHPEGNMVALVQAAETGHTDLDD